jgi:magnesium and cobalt transporter
MKNFKILNKLFNANINNKEELISLLKDAAAKHIIDDDALLIIEAALQMNMLRVKDIMIPRNQMDILDINDDIPTLITKIVETGHSRFPVVEGEISKVIGLFHSKDLIRYLSSPQNFELREHLRQAYFVPEIKHLDGLLYEMRVRQNHLAIVVDEFTNIVGIVTLEMVVEQLIGDIEDEYDSVEGERDIVQLDTNVYRVKGACKLSQINEMLHLNLNDSYVETIGGFLIKLLGRIPVAGEVLDFDNLTVEVVNSDSRKIKLLTLAYKS